MVQVQDAMCSFHIERCPETRYGGKCGSEEEAEIVFLLGVLGNIRASRPCSEHNYKVGSEPLHTFFFFFFFT